MSRVITLLRKMNINLNLLASRPDSLPSIFVQQAGDDIQEVTPL